MGKLKDQIAADKLKIAQAKMGITKAGESVEAFRRKLAQNEAGLSRLERAVRKATSKPLGARKPKFAGIASMLDKLVILAFLGLVTSAAALYMFTGRD